MLEIAAGVFTSPNMTPAIRDRVWAVLEKWRVGSHNDGAVMTWPDSAAPGGQAVQVLGEPPTQLSETPSVVLARRALSEDDLRSLTIQVDGVPF